MEYFSKSKVNYATHSLSPWYGECRGCGYCFNQVYRNLNYQWAVGELRPNEKALKLAKEASTKGVECLVVSFTSDPLPHFKSSLKQIDALVKLADILQVLEWREIPTKVLTKNARIADIAGMVDEPFEHVQIGMSLTTDCGNLGEPYKWERGVSGLQLRYDALRTLKHEGFRIWASGEPPLKGTHIIYWLQDILALGVEEVHVGRGNYINELKNAFDWRIFVQNVLFVKNNHVHGDRIQLKPELDPYLKKTLVDYCTSK